jgi:hypothetical protein
MADFWDVVGNIATGGLYGVGQALFNATQAADKVVATVGGDIEKIADEAATAIDKLFRSANTSAAEIAEFLKGLDELQKLDRPDGRKDSELWPEELSRKNALSALYNDLASQAQQQAQNIQNNGASISALKTQAQTDQTEIGAQNGLLLALFADPGHDKNQEKVIVDRINALIADMASAQTQLAALPDPATLQADLLQTQIKLALINSEIAGIVYQEPGSIPITAHFIAEAVTRLNTVEQPQVDDILLTADQNLAETRGMVQDIRKLLWIKTFRPRPSLTPAQQNSLDQLQELSRSFQSRVVGCEPARQQLAGQIARFKLPEALSTPLGDSGSETKPGEALLADRPVNLYAINRSLSQLSLLESQQRYYEYLDGRTGNEIQGILNEVVDEPGVLTQTIDEARKCLQQFNQQEQPRLDTILDSINQAVLETQKTLQAAEASLQQARTSLDQVQGFFSNRWVKIGALVLAGLVGLILLFSMIALFRVAFKI